MSECNHDCSSCSSKSTCNEKADFRVDLNEHSKVKKVIGIVSGKGGVGKSMVTSLLATSISKKNLNVGILDGDITGPSIPRAFGLNGKLESTDFGMEPMVSKGGVSVVSTNLLLPNQTDPIIWRGPIIADLVRQFWTNVHWNDIDVMFVDMPPGTGDVPLTVFQSLPVDGIILVTSPQELVNMIVEKTAKMAKAMNIPILGIVENMSYYVCPDCNKELKIFGESKIDEIAKRYDVDTISKLPINPELASLCDKGMIEEVNTDALNNIVDVIMKINK